MDFTKVSLTRELDTSLARQNYEKLDEEYYDDLESIILDHSLTTKDILQGFLSFTRRRDLVRLVAHYELFKIIQNLPGSIIEVGVYKGNGLFTWSKLMETFLPGDRIKKVIGFDHFQGYNNFHQIDENVPDFIDKNFKEKYDLKGDYNIIKKLIKLHNQDNIIRGLERCLLIYGDVMETIPRFITATAGLRISLLNLDVNLYEPTKLALEKFFPLVVPGGIISLNAYGQQPFEGESKAVDELIASLPYSVKLNRFPFSTIPSAYFIKQ